VPRKELRPQSPPDLSRSGPAPLIDLGHHSPRQNSDWLKWAIMFVVALGASVAGYLLLPRLP
jgi:hypothetical protein